MPLVVVLPFPAPFAPAVVEGAAACFFFACLFFLFVMATLVYSLPNLYGLNALCLWGFGDLVEGQARMW